MDRSAKVSRPPLNVFGQCEHSYKTASDCCQDCVKQLHRFTEQLETRVRDLLEAAEEEGWYYVRGTDEPRTGLKALRELMEATE